MLEYKYLVVLTTEDNEQHHYVISAKDCDEAYDLARYKHDDNPWKNQDEGDVVDVVITEYGYDENSQ